MSNKSIKFTDEEIKSLNDLSAEYQRIQASFGQLHVQKINAEQNVQRLEEAEVTLEAEYKSSQEKEADIVKALTEKYGPGSLDPSTGVFTPAETAEEPQEDEK